MNKLIATIHMSILARKYVSGESLLFQIKNQQVFLVFYAKDMGLASKKKLTDKCHSYQIPCYCLGNRVQMEEIFKKLALSARMHDRILKVARTTADLAGEEKIRLPDLCEAVSYVKNRDKFWGN